MMQDCRQKWMCAETIEDSLQYMIRPVRQHSIMPTMEPEPLVSIIIPNWNAKDYIQPCLAAVQASTYSRYEIIVVDNGSIDGSAEIARAAAPKASLICNSTNRGFSKACNQGLKASKGAVVIFLNADTEVSPGWIEPLLGVFKEHGDAAIAGSLLLFPDRKTVQAEGGLIVANGLAVHPRAGKETSSNDEPVSEVLYGAGASLAVRREVLEWFGGLDEGYSPAYFEDTDLALKVRRLGLKSYVSRRSVVVHHESYATKRASADFCYLYHRSRFRFVVTHFKMKSLLKLWSKAERYWYQTAGKDLQAAALKKAYRHAAIRWPGYLLDRWSLERKLRKLAKGLPGKFTRNVHPLLSKHQDEWRSPKPAGADLFPGKLTRNVHPLLSKHREERRSPKPAGADLLRMNPSVSVIILTHGEGKYLKDTVESVLKTDYEPLEIIIVDNEANEKTKELIATFPSSIIVVETGVNLGFAGGNDEGIKVSSGEIIILLNDDTRVEPNWVEAFVKVFRKFPQAGICGGLLLSWEGDLIQHAGGIVFPNGLTWHIGQGEPNQGQYSEIKETEYVTGAVFAIHRKVTERLGLLEPSYWPLYFEEVEYCLRARKAGFTVLFVPEAVVYHRVMETSGQFSQKYFFRYHRNRLRFVLRNYSLRQILRGLWHEVKWVASGNNKDQYRPLLKAYLDILLHPGSILKGRNSLKRRLN